VASITEPARATPVVADVDVLVVGGGTAGVSAAVAAAREGARVMLVERYGSLGGLATGGLIVLLLTLDDGLGRQVIAGLCQEITERLVRAGAAVHPPRTDWGRDDPELVRRWAEWGLVWGGAGAHHRVRYSVAYDPEAMRAVLNEVVSEAGVELRLHTWGADALMDGARVRGVAFQSKAGREAVLARVVVDASGDGDVFASAGCAYESERVHPWLWFRLGGVRDVDAVLAQAGRGPGWFRTPNPGVLLLPWGSVAKLDRRIDATNPRELTHAEVACRRLVMAEVERLRREVPELADAHVCNVATQLGITESRRLVGRRVLGRDDVGTAAPDAVAITGHWTKYGAVYAIPYDCLVPRETSNLLVAGRIISVDHRVHHATKEIPACMAVGEAAGIAAAMAAAGDGDVRRVEVAELRRRLVRRGALLDYFDDGAVGSPP